MNDATNLRDSQQLRFSISDERCFEALQNLGIALSSMDRIRILKLLCIRPCTLSELSKVLNVAVSSVSYHVDALVKANLATVHYRPGLKGHTKLCSRVALRIKIDLDDILSSLSKNNTVSVSMPVGHYISCDVEHCGIANEHKTIAGGDTSDVMYTPERMDAQLLWFLSGFVSYAFPNHYLKTPNKFRSVDFSLELCSEATYHRNDWPSDITFYVNDVEIATYTSPGDFGGRRGKLTPESWPLNSTQYGVLKHFTINENGVYIDRSLVNKSVTFHSLHLEENNFIKFTVGIKPNAVHSGGINIFGEKFGDYEQSIVMTLSE